MLLWGDSWPGSEETPGLQATPSLQRPFGSPRTLCGVWSPLCLLKEAGYALRVSWPIQRLNRTRGQAGELKLPGYLPHSALRWGSPACPPEPDGEQGFLRCPGDSGCCPRTERPWHRLLEGNQGRTARWAQVPDGAWVARGVGLSTGSRSDRRHFNPITASSADGASGHLTGPPNTVTPRFLCPLWRHPQGCWVVK